MKLPANHVTPEVYAACRRLGVPCAKPVKPRKENRKPVGKAKLSREELSRRAMDRKRRLRAKYKAAGLTVEGRPVMVQRGASDFLRRIPIGHSFNASICGKYERYWRAVAHRLGFRLKMDCGIITRIA